MFATIPFSAAALPIVEVGLDLATLEFAFEKNREGVGLERVL